MRRDALLITSEMIECLTSVMMYALNVERPLSGMPFWITLSMDNAGWHARRRAAYQDVSAAQPFVRVG